MKIENCKLGSGDAALRASHRRARRVCRVKPRIANCRIELQVGEKRWVLFEVQALKNLEHAAVNDEARAAANMSAEELSDRLLSFAARVGKLVDALPNTRLARHIAGQLVRSGTSPAPNYEEACGAESKRDFIHKMGICLKELRECRCWLRLIMRSDLLPEAKMTSILDECAQLCNIIGRSIVTARSKGTGTDRQPE